MDFKNLLLYLMFIPFSSIILVNVNYCFYDCFLSGFTEKYVEISCVDSSIMDYGTKRPANFNRGSRAFTHEPIMECLTGKLRNIIFQSWNFSLKWLANCLTLIFKKLLCHEEPQMKSDFSDEVWAGYWVDWFQYKKFWEVLRNALKTSKIEKSCELLLSKKSHHLQDRKLRKQ